MEINLRRINLSQPTGVSTFAIRTIQRTDPKIAKGLPPLPPEGKIIL